MAMRKVTHGITTNQCDKYVIAKIKDQKVGLGSIGPSLMRLHPFQYARPEILKATKESGQ